MKKVFSLLAAVLVTATMMADNHLKFKGMEIDGNLAKFSSELVKQGFTVVEKGSDGSYIAHMGKFAGMDDCAVVVAATPVEKVVYSVGVFLPEEESWYALKSTFEKFKANLTEKYGEPGQEGHSFESPFEEGDGYEMVALSRKMCTYVAFYYTDLGKITVMISSAGRGKGRVILLYNDKINEQLKNDAEKSSISNDL